jgi:hypothetical protein
MKNNIAIFEVLNTMHWAYTNGLLKNLDIRIILRRFDIDPNTAVIEPSHYEFTSCNGKTKYKKHFYETH